MATLKERVQKYAGTISDNAALDQWLTDGLRHIVGLVPIEQLEKNAQSKVADAVNGQGIADYRLTGVTRHGVPALMIPATHATKAGNANSLWFATEGGPVYYFENGKMFGLPSTGIWKFHGTPYASLTGGQAAVPYFPSEYEHIIVLYAAVQALLWRLEEARGNMPDAVDAPNFTFTPITAEVVADIFGVDDATLIADGKLHSINLTQLFADLFASLGLDQDDDIELASAKLNEINTKLGIWEREVRIEYQKLRENATAENDVKKFNAIQALEVAMRQWTAEVQLYTTEIGRYLQEAQLLTGTLVQVRQRYEDAMATAFGGKQS